jgi:hypothetical protein
MNSRGCRWTQDGAFRRLRGKYQGLPGNGELEPCASAGQGARLPAFGQVLAIFPDVERRGAGFVSALNLFRRELGSKTTFSPPAKGGMKPVAG